MEQEDPAPGDESRGRKCGRSVCDPAAEESDERQARDGECRRDKAESTESEPEMSDRERKHEVQRGTAAFARDVLEHTGQRVATNEECERLVFVRGPGHQLVHEEGGGGDRDRAHTEPEPSLGNERSHRADRRVGLRWYLCALCHRD